MLTEDEALNVAQAFLQDKYFNSKIRFLDNRLITRNNAQVYELHGEMNTQSHGVFDRFIIDKTANKYLFKIEIDAKEGCLVNYELT
ncbi:MAG: hypothetical protein FJ008_00605 [Chloroflexi bacterium]|nr:hypothetical protein [Chloroflexota bacterium]MBM3173476.1 hypothetical protein [Chloroflexota bacterium]MBM3174417.1 hypothetical protein [Chloroflexota bacterium]MBM4449401.1 hypothetical protein [Chloroflexota bacterium]